MDPETDMSMSVENFVKPCIENLDEIYLTWFEKI
jgi:hypothetical protein